MGLLGKRRQTLTRMRLNYSPCAQSIKRKYIRGCEPDQFTDYLSDPINKYIHEARYNSIIKLIMAIKPLNILDAGCGHGIFESLLKTDGFRGSLIGIDISLDAIMVAKSRNNAFDFLQADVEHLPFRKRVFDVTIATEVIEHLPNPIKALEESRECSKKYIVLTIPNVLSLEFLRAVGRALYPGVNLFLRAPYIFSTIILIVLGYFYMRKRSFFDHIYYEGVPHTLYSPEHFLEVCKQAKLRVLRVSSSSVIPPFFPFPRNKTLKHYVKKTLSFWAYVDRLLVERVPAMGISLILLCQKGKEKK